MSRLDEALAIRDHVLKLMEGRSEWREFDGPNGIKIKVQCWGVDGFYAALNTPFNPTPNGSPPATSYAQAIYQQENAWKHENGYRLDLSCRGIKGKALNIEWGGSKIFLRAFKRGDWEQRLLELPAGEAR